MGQSLAAAAVSGTQSTPKASEEFLAAGDIEGLLSFRRAEFGGFTMKAKDEDDDPDDDEDEDEEDEDSDEEDEDSEDEDESDEDDEDGDKGKKAKKVDPRDTKIQELSAEAKKRRLTVRDLKRKNADLEAENARLKGKAKKGDEDTDEEDEKSTKPDTALQERLRTQTIRTEFTDLVTAEDAEIRFKDNKAAFRLLDLDDVDVDDDDEVEGLEDAIKDLAEQYPWLLVEPEKAKPSNGRRKTGQPTGRKKGSKPNTDALRKKYRV